MINDEAIEIYTSFKKKSGSEFIAKPVSIDFLIKYCKKDHPKRILELGAGIGTISYVLLKYSNAFVDMYEENDFCKVRLEENLASFKGRYRVIPSYKILPPSDSYDLIVVDGGGSKQGDTGYTKAIWFFIHSLKSVKSIYFEGSRKLQQIWARKALKDRFIFSIVKHKPVEFKGEMLVGGMEYRCRRVTSTIVRYAHFFMAELREWYPLKYFIRYKIKRIKSVMNDN